MKKQFKGFILGFLICAIITSSIPAFATVATKSIKVLLNSVSVKVNSTTLTKDNIVYNGKVYLNANSVSGALNKTYIWNKKTSIITINDKATPIPSPTNTPLPTPTPQIIYVYITPTPTLTPTPNPVASFSNPASINQAAQITYSDLFDNYSARVTITGIIRGSEAWTMVKNANTFNEEAKNGYEYIVAKIKFELLDIKDGKAFDLSRVSFNLISENGKEYDTSLVVAPEPDIRANLYKGASNEGYVVYEVQISDTKPKIAFGRNYDGTGGIWFRAYKD